ncbi:hypothetical protein OTU49_017534 [Cherax quadricarinatus]
MADAEATDAASHDSRHDHGDSWEHQDEDDDVGDPRRRYFSRNDDDEEDEAEEGPRRTALIKYDNEEMRDEERGEGAVETNILTTRARPAWTRRDADTGRTVSAPPPPTRRRRSPKMARRSPRRRRRRRRVNLKRRT